VQTIIHIVPSYPPIKGGIADFCKLIVNSLNEKKHYIISYQQNAVICGSTNKVLINYKNFSLKKYLQFTLNNIPSNTSITLMLHYVSYGYHKYGVPNFLFKDIRSFSSQLKLITFFHEIYSIGKKTPKQSSFWCKPLQKSIILKLSKISHTVFTSNDLYKEKIENLGVSKSILIQNIYSNVGELKDFPSNKKQQLVIFGGKGLKKNIVHHIDSVEKKVHSLKIDEIINVGAPLSINSINNKTIKDLGYLATNDIETLFKTAKYGLISYNNMPIEKSGVFAAYAAYGIIPILINSQVTSPKLKTIISEPLQLFNWYKENASITCFSNKLNTIINGY